MLDLPALTKWTRKTILESDADSVMLVGSQARKDAWPDSDIDLIVVRKNAKIPIQRSSHSFLDNEVDVFVYDNAHFLSSLHQEPRNANDLDNISLFLSYLHDGLVLWDKNDTFTRPMEEARNWK